MSWRVLSGDFRVGAGRGLTDRTVLPIAQERLPATEEITHATKAHMSLAVYTRRRKMRVRGTTRAGKEGRKAAGEGDTGPVR